MTRTDQAGPWQDLRDLLTLDPCAMCGAPAAGVLSAPSAGVRARLCVHCVRAVLSPLADALPADWPPEF